MPLDPREKAIRQRLKDDFPHYAKKCLRIRPKEGAPVNELPALDLNEAQMYLHACCEKQLRESGRIRVIVLKGRQQGVSTYTEGRFYWKVSHRRGVNAYILTHEDPATTNLFNMAKTYHDNCKELVRPSTSASNAKELIFDRLSSGYKVGTAGSKGTGRSLTLQYFHGSEVAYWPNAETHMAGVLQAVADVDGTEIILESTSNGPAGVFFEMCMKAHKRESEWELVFIPWFWTKDYRKPVPQGFELTSEEEEYKSKYKLTDEQIYWRRLKIIQLNGVHHFRREYPATVEEAFKAAAIGALWTEELLAECRIPTLPVDDDGNPIQFKRVVIAVDPSGSIRGDVVGIIGGGLGYDGIVYIWRDNSGKMSPATWAKKSVGAYKDEQADVIVAEANFGGDMVKLTIQTADPKAHVKLVHASRGKQIRAEPVVALYQQGKVKHVGGGLIALEDEMTTWVPGEGESPGRVDGAVWLVTELLIGGPGEIQTSSF